MEDEAFNDIIGQEEAIKRLLQMVGEKRIPHALLFCGPEGCGKMALAMAFARYLLTEDTMDANARKSAVAMLSNWEHPDLHFTYPTINSGTGSDHKPVSDDFARQWHQLLSEGTYFTIEQWLQLMGGGNKQAIITAAESDAIAHNLSLMSSQGGYKISLVWLPERFNQEAANKLLKLLEEPPHKTLFLLVSEHPERILDTIRSRTQLFEMKKIDTPDIERNLIKRRGIGPEDAHRIARVVNGNWNLALKETVADNENEEFLDKFEQLMRQAYSRRVQNLKNWSDQINDFGREKQIRMLTYFLHLVRENFIYNFHRPELNYMTQKEENFSRNFARFIHENNILSIARLFNQALTDIRRNANAKIVFYHVALQTMLSIRK
ncbi:MAG: DNA polymerase III subunit delta [Prevotella sp.]|jgi:DNA polymerase-3 subunit delta'|nr:DNA polymerase III subunit delta' [Prevotella sp.]MCH3970706.1 DNA polymerase III subunit delta [Prevotella sp.]